MNKKIATLLVALALMFSMSTSAFAGTVERYVNFRSAPSTNSKVYKTLRPGTSFVLLDKVNAWWLKIKVGSTIGYVSPYYVNTGARPAATAPSAPSAPATTSHSSSKADRVIADAKALMGKVTYRYGVNKAPTVMDCSGFTKYVYGKEGIKLGWGTRFQKTAGSYVSKANLKKGDLVFFRVGSSTQIGHVGIYLGNGQFIHNSPSIKGGVGIASMTSGYWKTRYVTGRRVL